jgi:hypothetical protein
MADVATLNLRLAEAELAYHKLMTGAASVSVQQDDMQLTFNIASVDKLRIYIAELKSQLVAAGALDATGAGRRKPLYVEL